MLLALATFALRIDNFGPTLPTASSPAFHATVDSIEDALQHKDFETAKARLQLLPKAAITIGWDESNVPEGYRPDYRNARDEAIAMWKKKLPMLSISLGSKSDIQMSFQPKLAERPGADIPAAQIGFFRQGEAGPRLDYVMGLKIGRPLQATSSIDVFDQVAYGIGMYFGIADGVTPTYVMGITDLPNIVQTTMSGTEIGVTRMNLKIAEEVKKAVANKTVLIPAEANMYLASTEITTPKALQGDLVPVSFQLVNRGNGPLSFGLFPDCGCTAVDDPGDIPPQESRTLRVAINTRFFDRNMVKHVIVYTNDPTTPVTKVTIHVPVQPRYRVFSVEPETIVVPKEGRKAAVYFIPAPGSKMTPVSETFEGGINAKVSVQPFSGMLADPEMGEGPKMRKGYKYIFDIKGNLPPGRTTGTLQIYTTDIQFSNITYNIYAQSGIIAQPDEVSLGHLGHVPRTASFTVSEPGIPFKVVSVKSSSEHIAAVATLIPGGGDYRIELTYDGKAKSGDFMASVKVMTSDPKQRIIDVPVSATVE